jgi:WD40 repeat protein
MSRSLKNIRASRVATAIVLGSSMASVLAVALVHCVASNSPVIAASQPSYREQIAPILQKNCLDCHSSVAHRGGLALDSYEALMKGGKHGPAITPHDANGSRLIGMMEGKIDPQMPYNADPLPESDIAAIRAWIDAGAEGPPADESTKVVAPLQNPAIQPQVTVVSPVTAVKFSPDGRMLAVGGYREVRLLDPLSGKVLAVLAGHADYVRSIAFSPDGNLLAAAGGAPQRFGEIKIWDAHSHQLLKSMQGHKDCIYSISWSPNGKFVASGSYDKMVKVWDVSAGREAMNLQDHIDAVFAVAFSPDGKTLASASQDRTVKIWDVETGHRLYTLSDASDGLTSVAYSPSGNRLAAVGYDKTIYVWKLAKDDGQLSQSLIADEDSLLAIIWSHDGNSIVTASSDGSIRFRDTKLALIGVIDHQPDWVEAMDISPDGKWLAAGRYNGALSIYDTKTYKDLGGQMAVFERTPTNIEISKKEAVSR